MVAFQEIGEDRWEDISGPECFWVPFTLYHTSHFHSCTEGWICCYNTLWFSWEQYFYFCLLWKGKNTLLSGCQWTGRSPLSCNDQKKPITSSHLFSTFSRHHNNTSGLEIDNEVQWKQICNNYNYILHWLSVYPGAMLSLFLYFLHQPYK